MEQPLLKEDLMDEVALLPDGYHVVVPLDTRIGRVVMLNRKNFGVSRINTPAGGCFVGRACYTVSLALVEQIVQALSPNLT